MKKLLLFAICLMSLLTAFSFNAFAKTTNLYPAKVEDINGEKWGYIDQYGQFKISAKYDIAQDFNDKGIAIVGTRISDSNYADYNIRFIDQDGYPVLGPFKTYIPNFNLGVVIINLEGNKSIVVNDEGEIIVERKGYIYQTRNALIYSNEDRKAYGIMDLKGNIITKPIYKNVVILKDENAVVTNLDGTYCLIDNKGKEIKKLKDNVYNLNDGMYTYYDEKIGKYGYKDMDGKIVVHPIFDMALDFEDGFAIVSVNKKDIIYWGVIDKSGEYVIKADYSSISYIGNGLYAASNKFYEFMPYMVGTYLPKAIINTKGQRLSDFIYYETYQFKNGYASVTDEKSTFFINEKGQIAKELPKVDGIGQLTIFGDVVKSEVDNKLSYLTKDGSLIWSQNPYIELDDSIKIERVSLRKDFCTLFQYPKITGLSDQKAQKTLNDNLKKKFIEGYDENEAQDGSFINTLDINFSLSRNKNLLTITKNGYMYPVGAAHGSPLLNFFHIDLKTGNIYEIANLFKKDSKYLNKLTILVNEQIKNNNKISGLTGNLVRMADSATVTNDKLFEFTNDSLVIYFDVYEIGPYAAGFPEFKIPYGQIMDIIDTKSQLWNCFDKKIVKTIIKKDYEIDEAEEKKITDVIKKYEIGLIDAINKNDFKKVEPVLLKNSSIYNAQKKLIVSLNKQKVKEKLSKYEIYYIYFNTETNKYMVYVNEEIGIKYDKKDYVTKKFSYYYCLTKDFKIESLSKW